MRRNYIYGNIINNIKNSFNRNYKVEKNEVDRERGVYITKYVDEDSKDRITLELADDFVSVSYVNRDIYFYIEFEEGEFYISRDYNLKNEESGRLEKILHYINKVVVPLSNDAAMEVLEDEYLELYKEALRERFDSELSKTNEAVRLICEFDDHYEVSEDILEEIKDKLNSL